MKVIYLKMEPYLRQWFIHENGGKVPVDLHRSSPESNIFQAFIAKAPEDWCQTPDEDSVPIIVPVFKGLNPECWCYLPPRAMQTLYNCIKSSFDVQLFQELHSIGQKGTLLSDLIYSFMEKHGIEDDETNWNTLAKIYMRKRKNYMKNVRRKLKKS